MCHPQGGCVLRHPHPCPPVPPLPPLPCSDGSNVDWGFKLNAVGEVRGSAVSEFSLLGPELVDNDWPFFFGSAPFWAADEAPAPCALSDFRVVGRAALDGSAIAARVAATRAQFSTGMLGALLAVRPDQSADHVLDALALSASCAPASLPVQLALCAKDTLRLLLPLVFTAQGGKQGGVSVPQLAPLSLRLGATRVLQQLLPSAPAAVDEVRRKVCETWVGAGNVCVGWFFCVCGAPMAARMPSMCLTLACACVPAGCVRLLCRRCLSAPGMQPRLTLLLPNFC